MNDYYESTYGERISGVYDDLYSEYDPKSIETLSELARNGPALELGIGTGRIALPLSQKGIEVHGIDASEAMLAKLRLKPGGADIPVTVGNFAEVAAEGRFSLVYVVFNTFFALLTQDDQIRCFMNVASHLLPDGVFLMEVFVPDLTRFISGQTFRVVRMDENHVHLEASLHDPVRQQVTSRHVHLTEVGVQLYPVKLRYAWPSELDLMARLAGMKLQHRWGDWDRSDFTDASGRHISVYSHSQD